MREAAPPAKRGGRWSSWASCVRMGEKKCSAVLPRTRKSSRSHSPHATWSGTATHVGLSRAAESSAGKLQQVEEGGTQRTETTLHDRSLKSLYLQHSLFVSLC